MEELESTLFNSMRNRFKWTLELGGENRLATLCKSAPAILSNKKYCAIIEDSFD